MRNWFRHLSKTQVVSYILFAVSAVILAASVYFSSSVDVLKDWRIILPDQDIHVGDTIVVESVYTKVRNVTGTSVRYLECKNESGIYLRYPLSEAVADRKPRTGGTGIRMVIPETIPDVPTTCKVSITIDYEIWKLQHVIEAEESKEFKLLPKRKEAAKADTSSQTNQIAEPSQSLDVIATAPVPPVSSSQSNPPAPTAQRDISLGDEVANPERQLTPLPEVGEPVCEPVVSLPLIGTLYCRYG